MDFMPESTAITSLNRVHQSPITMVDTPSSSYSGACMLTYHKTIHSPTMSSSEEEEDMANCLIMLAHSVSPVKEDRSDICCQKTEKLKTRSVTEIGTNSGFHSYDCKTCNRSFPSFQALGGHRASHKKPKLTVDEKTTVSLKPEYSEESQPKLVVVYEQKIKTVTNKYPSPATTNDHSIQTGHKNGQTKVHQCSICGSEFFSGQALGGHMRRHRAAPPPIIPTKPKLSPEKPRVVSLDLNLPPPEVVDDGFQFTASSSQQPPLVFSAAALVDCHY